MHELQSLLLKKIPRLWELTFWCEVKIDISWEEWNYILWEKYWLSWDNINSYEMVWDNYITFNVQSWYENCWCETYKILEIIGHPFTHADILEALGEDWAMDWAYYLFNHVLKWRPDFPEPILLPSNISDLYLPEYEETRKQLIQLLTK